MTELIEDMDGAPLPAELQRDGPIWGAVHLAIDPQQANPDRARFNQWARTEMTDDVMIALAPLLWPLLPSNDVSATAVLRRSSQTGRCSMTRCLALTPDDRLARCDQVIGHPGPHALRPRAPRGNVFIWLNSVGPDPTMILTDPQWFSESG